MGSSRGPFRASHLRHVSTGSLAIVDEDEYLQSPKATEELPESSFPERAQCSLWVHDDNFSQDEVLLNPTLFSSRSIKAGDLMQVIALDQSQQDNSRPQGPSLQQENRRRNGKGHEPLSSAEPNPRALDSKKRYIFVYKEMDPEMGSKQPNIQVSCSYREHMCHKLILELCVGFRIITDCISFWLQKSMSSCSVSCR